MKRPGMNTGPAIIKNIVGLGAKWIFNPEPLNFFSLISGFFAGPKSLYGKN